MVDKTHVESISPSFIVSSPFLRLDTCTFLWHLFRNSAESLEEESIKIPVRHLIVRRINVACGYADSPGDLLVRIPANEYTVGHPSLSKKSLVAMPTVLGRLRFESPQSLRLAGKPHNIVKLVMHQRPGFCSH